MVRLLCVLGHGYELLPHFIEHYSKYVDELNFVLYESELTPRIVNRSKAIINSYDNCKILGVVRERVYDWEKVTILYNMYKNKRKRDWWVIADIDEFQLYPDNDLDKLVSSCDDNLWDIARGGFIDRIGPDGEFSTLQKDTSIFEQYPYAGFFRYPLSQACPNKVSLVRGDIEITNGQHYAKINGHTTWRWQGWEHPSIAPYQTHSIQVHHFKWDDTSIKRIKSVADINQPYAFSKEYRKMYDELRRRDFRLNVRKRDFMFLKCDKPDYNSYRNWDKLIRKIISI